MAAAGAWVSWHGLPGVILIYGAVALVAALLSPLIRSGMSGRIEWQREIPSGPFLAALSAFAEVVFVFIVCGWFSVFRRDFKSSPDLDAN